MFVERESKKRRLCCRGMGDLIMPAPSDIRRFLGLLYQRLGRVGGEGGGLIRMTPKRFGNRHKR